MASKNSNVPEHLKNIPEFYSTPNVPNGRSGEGDFETGRINVVYSGDPTQYQSWFAFINSNASAILFPIDDPILSVFPKTVWGSVQKAYEKYNIANKLDNLGEYNNAEISYWESLKIKPTPEAFANLAHIFLVQERYNDAVLVCRQGIRTTKVIINDGIIYIDDFDIFGVMYANMGLALHNLMKLQEAEQALRKSISINPNVAMVQFNWANLLDNLRRPQESENAYRKAIKIAPNFAEAYFNLGILLAKQKRNSEANFMIEKALELNPNLQRFLGRR